MTVLCVYCRRAIAVGLVAVGITAGASSAELFAVGPPSYIPATSAFDNPGCSDSDLGDVHDLSRSNPEWKAIVIDPNHPLPNNPPTILEGFVAFPPATEKSNDQAPAEVSEEELPWNHYTHDYTFKVVPDPPYQNLLSSWNRFPGLTINNISSAFCVTFYGGVPVDSNSISTTCNVPQEVCPDLTTGDTCHHTLMEVEWENASVMKVNDDDDRQWGSLPEFAWPSSGDRVWVEGRWIFDCGHAGVPKAAPERQYVKFDTEIHPPRALATFRLNHPALSSLADSSSHSWLPVTGAPNDRLHVANSGPTNVPLTEADIFVSGNGGGANDYCSLTMDCPDSSHTGPLIPVNDRNYVFDIYPPGTDYLHPLGNGSFPVTPPVGDASLQWRIVDQRSQLPDHACGPDKSFCSTVEPKFCPIDASTPPPPQDQTNIGTDCPMPVPEQPTRLRVILPFKNSSANFFARSILLGWDDVPAHRDPPLMRAFQVSLHKFTVLQNGEGCSVVNGCVIPIDGDWRVFVDVGGQWRYMSALMDANSDGKSVCNGADPLTENGDDDCYQFDRTPWTVTVMDGDPIHVAVGGFESDGVDGNFCRDFAGTSCSPGIHGYFDLAFENDDRIGTYEFDLQHQHDYQWRSKDGNTALTSFTTDETSDEEQYKVEFVINEIPAADPPVSDALQIGAPHYVNYVSSATPFVLSSSSLSPNGFTYNAEGFQYRFRPQGGSLPVFASTLPFPVHWTRADFPQGSLSVSVYLAGAGLTDGPYDLQYSANSFANLLEPRHATTVILDNTPPVASIAAPAAIQYVHSDSFTIDFSVSDGAGSGVKSDTANIDGQTTLYDGTTPVTLADGVTVKLLTELALGTHTFNVVSVDNVINAGTNSVTFSVIVTAESIKADVRQFVAAGKITVDTGNSLLGILDAAAAARGRGQCSTAANLYQAFITQVNAQSGKQIDPTAAQIMILDAQYLIAHCP